MLPIVLGARELLQFLRLRLATSGPLLSLAIALVIGAASPPLAVPTTITFETISSSGEIVRNQFASSGIIFQPVHGVDYVQGMPDRKSTRLNSSH